MEIKRIDTGVRSSRAVAHNGVIHFGGHVSAAKEPTMKEQMISLTKRLEGLLEEHSSSKNHILSAMIHISDFSMFDEMNEIWDKWIDEGCAPTRTCVEAVISPGVLVEITLVAALK